MTARRWPDTLRWCGAIAVAILAGLRAVTLFAPSAVFDTDPALDPSVLGGLALAGSLRLDTAILLVAGIALLGESRRDGGLRLGLVVAALVPVPVILAHGWGDAEDLRIGATWIAAMIAAVVMVHAARDARLRVVLAVVLLSVLAPVFIRGIATATVEHGQTVAEFEANRDRILLDKGWRPESPAARIFERRLRQAQPTAWFVTTNVFGTFAILGTVLCAGLLAAGWRHRVRRDALVLIAALGLGALALTRWTGSMGALVSALVGCAVVVAAAARPSLARPRLTVGIVLIVLGTIALRGTVLPESFAGDRSLLFRWHYQVGSARALAEAPVLGVGPAGLQDVYVRHRPPRSPEEISSTHSVFTDWVVRAGPGALAWVGIAFALIAGLGPSLRDDTPPAPVAPGIWVRALGAAGVLGIGTGMLFELPVLNEAALAVRVAGVAGFLALGALLACFAARAALWPGLAAAALALVVHAQVEMTMTQPGSAVWSLALLGVAAAPSLRRSGAEAVGARRGGGAALAGIVLAIGAWIGITGARPAARLEAAMFDAARLLWPLADARAALATPPGPARPLADAILAETLSDLGVTARTPEAIEGALLELERTRRPQAAEALLAARGIMPSSVHPAEAALTQLERANWRETGERRIAVLQRELALAHEILPRSGRATTLLPWIHLELFQLTGDEAHRAARLDALAARTEADPWGLLAWLTYADALWDAGQADEARAAYRRVLECDANFELDPLKQLGDADRARARSRS